MRRERPGPGQESVWDYPRPPSLEPTGRRIRIVVAGETIVDTTSAWRVLETSHPPGYYIPPGEIRPGVLDFRRGRIGLRVEGTRRILLGAGRGS